jgi:branched-chain amino acid transport system ATP-binding protein
MTNVVDLSSLKGVAEPLLSLTGISKSFGGVQALHNATINVSRGTIHALIGPNGAGKTTLFNIAAGVVSQSSGCVIFQGHDVSGLSSQQRAAAGLQRTFQNLQTFWELTALEIVMVGQHLNWEHGFWKSLFAAPSIQHANAQARLVAEQMLERVGIAHLRNEYPGGMSYGALKRLDVARALAAGPTLLLMDEPAAGLNPSETSAMGELIRQIAGEGITVLLVEHDMKLVMNIAEWVIVLNHGTVLTEGAPRDVSQNPEVVSAYLGASRIARRRR